MSKLRLETPDRLDTGTTAATEGLSAFEAVPEGQPFAAEAASATEGVELLKAGARTALFPTHVAMTADVTTTFLFYEELFPRSRYATHAAELHAECLVVQPDLAAFLRSGPVCARVRAAAAATAPASGTAIGAAEQVAVESYVKAIAGQMIGIGEFEPHASLLAVTVPALEARLEACKARHQQHVASELARIEGEKQAADKVIADAERQRREKVAEYFMTRHGFGFLIRGERFSGGALAQVARRIGVRDDDGYFVKFTLEELETARDRQMAADAAVAGGVQ